MQKLNWLRRRLDAAQGRIPADLQIRNVRYLDVFACRFREGDITVVDGVIVGVEPGLDANRVIDANGAWVVPGFVDAHVHLESSLLLPGQFERLVLAKGTTRVVCDPHEIANVLGTAGIRFFLESALRSHLDIHVMLSSCVPATHLETNGAGSLMADDLLPLLEHPRALGLAEVMNFPGVLAGDEQLLEKIDRFGHRPLDGHSPLLGGHALSAYASTGISSDHESSRLDEASEKLSKGMSIWIREGSVAKDLNALVPLLTLATSTSIGFCTDDRNPLEIAEEGHIDHSLRRAIAYGVPPEVVYRAAAWSAPRHYGIRDSGAVAPGYVADLVLLDDAPTCSIRKVFKRGVPVDELPSVDQVRPDASNTVRAIVPDARQLEGPSGRVHVIDILPGKIITGRHVDDHDAPGIARLTVLERHGHGLPPANGYVRGFGDSFTGAIAASVAHDSHNLIAAGSNTEDMRVALTALSESGGGFCVAARGSVRALLPLPFAGLMSLQDAAAVTDALKGLRKASKEIGCSLGDPFLQLSFLALPVIPALKLTDKGLVDVERFEIVDVRAG
jgi:adenine deaminase